MEFIQILPVSAYSVLPSEPTIPQYLADFAQQVVKIGFVFAVMVQMVWYAIAGGACAMVKAFVVAPDFLVFCHEFP
jgi:hypothetical protein